MAWPNYQMKKRDCAYLIVIGGLLLLLYSTTIDDSSMALLSHLGLASAIASIVLAVVAIVHNLITGARTEQALTNIQLVSHQLRTDADELRSHGLQLREDSAEFRKQLQQVPRPTGEDASNVSIFNYGTLEFLRETCAIR